MNDIIKYIKQKTSISPDLAVVLGSGLSDLQNILNDKIVIYYSEIPG